MKFLSVGLFGAIGAGLRYLAGLFLLIPGFPLNTLVVNIVGCFALGFFSKNLTQSSRISETLAIGINTGLIGSFTTFSAFSLEILLLVSEGRLFLAALYLILSIILGFVAAGTGDWAAEKRLDQTRLARQGG